MRSVWGTVTVLVTVLAVGAPVVSASKAASSSGEGGSVRVQEKSGERFEWVRIPGGTFLMGSKQGGGLYNEHPRHRVTIPTFELLMTEVTVRQYRACVRAGACSEPHSDDGTCHVWNGSEWKKDILPAPFREGDHPVVCVDWEQARRFTRWLAGGARLPTEAEWEYAARSGGRESAYPWGGEEVTCRRAVVSDDGKGCGRDSTSPVCSKPAGRSAQGVCDLIGNVSEWCEDQWHSDYVGAPTDGSAWENRNEEAHRLSRGGSYADPPDTCRATARDLWNPGQCYGCLGFRPARSLP